MEKLYSFSAVELVAKLKNKEITVSDLVNSVYDRIDEVEEKIGSYVSIVSREKALESAKISQAKYDNGTEGTLEGIPVAIKDNMVSDGERTSAASKILENYVNMRYNISVNRQKRSCYIICA